SGSASRCNLNRVDDSLTGSATTNVSVHSANYIFAIWFGVLREQCTRRHDHSRSAIGALHRVGLDESFLERMQLAVFLERFDGGDLFPRGASNLSNARTGRHAVKQDCAGATLTLTASILAAGKIQVVTQDGEQTDG